MGDGRSRATAAVLTATAGAMGPALACNALVGIEGPVMLDAAALESGAHETTVSDASEAALPPCQGAACNAVVDFSGGKNFACVVLASGDVWCWGGDEFGQLGVAATERCVDSAGPLDCRPAPARIPGVRDATAIAAGDGFACALLRSSDLVCWGRNDRQQLGHLPGTMAGDETCPGDDVTGTPCSLAPTPVRIRGAVVQVATGAGFACAVTQPTGQVYCWGDGSLGETGNGMSGPDASFGPAPLAGNAHAGSLPAMVNVSVTGTMGHACAIDVNRNLWCWGDNTGGDLGHPLGTHHDLPSGPHELNPVPRLVAESHSPTVLLADLSSVATPDVATCASDGSRVWCWGSDLNCDNGRPGVPDVPVPSRVDAPARAVFSSVSSRARHVCALSTDHSVYCWGDNQHGQLGIGSVGGPPGADAAVSSDCYYKPQRVGGLPKVEKIVGAVGDFVLVQAQGGALYSWGINGAGESGHPPDLGAHTGDQLCGSSVLCNSTPSEVRGLPPVGDH
jgi:alpha-tubulin suppressor-like RCC1 family protein